MIITTMQLNELKATLESVTNDFFKQEIAQDDATTLLCAWRSITHVDYILHIMRRNYDTFQVCLACQKYRDIQTRYDHKLSTVEMNRFLNDPRLCVRYWVGQIQDT